MSGHPPGKQPIEKIWIALLKHADMDGVVTISQLHLVTEIGISQTNISAGEIALEKEGRLIRLGHTDIAGRSGRVLQIKEEYL